MRAGQLLGVAAALAATVEGQSGDGTTTVTQVTTTSTAPSTTWTIEVGAEGFKFTPKEIPSAAVGDIIEFRLYPGNHTVARSDFGTPCLPYEYTGLKRKGFFSGYIGPQVITNDLPKLQVRVNDTEPIFFYCTAPGSCFQHHMIGVVNPNSIETLDLQQQYAINSTTQLAPGDPFPSETLNPTSTPSTTAVGSGTGNQDNHDHPHHGLGPGAIAGIAIGGAAVLILAGALIFLCGRRGGLDVAYRRSAQTFPPSLVEEAKYNPHNPKSPGHQSYSSPNYTVPMVNDPYQGTHPHTHNSSPPPVAPSSHPAYSVYSSTGGQPSITSPLSAGVTDGTQGYYPGLIPSPAEAQVHPQTQQAQVAPVELPTSGDPGNSPLPGYQSTRTYSWRQGQETQYRPGSKA